jgi:UTP--glucose-1-phosphate uridylyltransferase
MSERQGGGGRVRKAVFPAAGYGTRFLPATKAQPKEMLPLVDKPVIQYVVEEALASGIRDMVMITGRGKRALEDHFDVAVELEDFLAGKGSQELLEEVKATSELADFIFMRQKKQLGLGHAVLVARDLVGDEPFAVFLGDDVITADVPVMKQMLEVFARERCSVLAVERVPREKTSSYGIIRPEKGGGPVHRVIDLVEKPPPEEAPSDLAIVGRYILTPEIFACLENTAIDSRGEIQLTNGLRALLSEQPIVAYEFTGTHYDTGNKLGFLKATVEHALHRSDIGPAFREYLKNLKLG